MDIVLLADEGVPNAWLMKNTSECSEMMLERWLECHGAKKTGPKQQLIYRVKGCLAISR